MRRWSLTKLNYSFLDLDIEGQRDTKISSELFLQFIGPCVWGSCSTLREKIAGPIMNVRNLFQKFVHSSSAALKIEPKILCHVVPALKTKNVARDPTQYTIELPTSTKQSQHLALPHIYSMATGQFYLWNLLLDCCQCRVCREFVS